MDCAILSNMDEHRLAVKKAEMEELYLEQPFSMPLEQCVRYLSSMV